MNMNFSENGRCIKISYEYRLTSQPISEFADNLTGSLRGSKDHT